MSCNQDCNQGRKCDCNYKEVRKADLIGAGILGLLGGALLALAYVIRTGGF